MPFKSAAQKRLFQAAANNPKFAKKVGIPVATAKKMVKHAKPKKK